MPDLAQSTSLGAQSTHLCALGLSALCKATSSPRELRANPSATTTTPAPLVLLAFGCTSWLPAPVGASVAGSRPVCAPRGALFSSSAVEWEEGCPFHLCSSVLQLLSCSTGASDQQSRRTKWDWFMAGPVFDQSSCGAGAEAFAVFLAGSFLRRAPHCCWSWRRPPHRSFS